jgi:hypothetical protein
LKLASTPSFDLAVGAGVRGEVRIQDHLKMEQVARVAIGGGVGIDLTLKSIPLTIGLRFEPSFTDLGPGVRAHGFMLELGYEWR